MALHARLAGWIVLLASAFLLLPSAAVAGHEWGSNPPYHWSGTGERTISMNDGTPPPVGASPWTSYIFNAESDWEASPRISLVTQVWGGCQDYGGAINVCAADYADSCGDSPQGSWVGCAGLSVYTPSNHIAKGSVRFDNVVSGWNWTSERRSHVVCMEIGHTLGLQHRTDVSSCMYNPISTGDSPDPDAHDYSVINTSHGHNDGGSSPVLFNDVMNEKLVYIELPILKPPFSQWWEGDGE